ncbi:MAG TPA: 4-(cytidine 5'-diphospho)-2-C-methyl-D-erythritol kinase [bacterium]|nr:4-(cytidine 5'-diphospho)-2-C-methyl-D-erythritol kinase [bacterium]
MLRITGRRADGYHQLQTVFQLLDFGDRLAFELRDDGQIIKHTPLEGVAEDAGLATRAARLLQQTCGTRLGVDIFLEKHIPLGGGLGGGSSDAATTLRVLNQLWGCQLSIDTLAELGASLGADVPVFVRGHSAWAEGIGEQLTPITLPATRYLVVCPPVHLSTARMFADPLLVRDQPPIRFEDFQQGERDNAFTPVARARSEDIDKLFHLLSAYATPQLTGSGAAIFCAFSPEDPALERAAHALPKNLPRFIAQGLNTSPLHAILPR